MSLTVSPQTLALAEHDQLTDADFVSCIQTSLPLAWEILERISAAAKSTGGHAIDAPEHMADDQRGQLLRIMASSSMRNAVQQHFGVVFEFQNCHKSGAFLPGEVGSAAHRTFVSARAQILNQSPGRTDC